MSQMPADGSGAPPFMGPTPPDRVQMSFEQHCDGILARVAQGPLPPEQMQYFAATMAQVQEILAGYQGGMDPNAPAGETGAPEQSPDETRDYGEEPGSKPYGEY